MYLSTKVVLASFPDLECGFARDLFLQWAPHAVNSIVLTARTSPGTLARDLIERGGDRTIELTVKKRVRLEGAELDQFLLEQKTNLNNTVKEDPAGISSDSDSDDSLEMMVVTGRHDIPVRSDHRTASRFKSNKRHHAMYPCHDERTRYDDYGEIIKPEDYRLAEIIDTEGDVKDVSPAAPQKMEIEEELPEIPRKCISYTTQVHIQARIQYIELEGRCDGESLLRIVSQVKPRALVALRAGPDALKVLRQHCEAEGIEKVYTPSRGETIDATTESHIYQVRLSDALVSGLEWRSAGDISLAWLSAVVAPPRHSRERHHDQQDEPLDLIPSLEPAPNSEHAASFINSLKLSNLRQVLAKHNIRAEFNNGELSCCNGTIAIRRLDNGRVALEGVLSDEYYKVRELLYDQFAIV
ncbi:unnamed protein product [Plutella xylostella]|uniref:Cleavage and polyadenylation specificity factor subunit 2 n=1 Tax=Plutella xylostella TaxID=51655 RepID=A0A8S4DU77_PLUXY|nr:unnamed protein product [Plutella xylostella]